MTSFMIVVIIALFMVLLGFSWYRLEAFEEMDRVIICIAGILSSWLITTLLFNASSIGIDYINIDIKHEISKILVLVFTPINGIVYMPYLSKIMSKVKFEEMTKKQATKKIAILACLSLIVFIFEIFYLKHVQLGIFEVARSL